MDRLRAVQALLWEELRDFTYVYSGNHRLLGIPAGNPPVVAASDVSSDPEHFTRFEDDASLGGEPHDAEDSLTVDSSSGSFSASDLLRQTLGNLRRAFPSLTIRRQKRGAFSTSIRKQIERRIREKVLKEVTEAITKIAGYLTGGFDGEDDRRRKRSLGLVAAGRAIRANATVFGGVVRHAVPTNATVFGDGGDHRQQRKGTLSPVGVGIATGLLIGGVSPRMIAVQAARHQCMIAIAELVSGISRTVRQLAEWEPVAEDDIVPEMPLPSKNDKSG